MVNIFAEFNQNRTRRTNRQTKRKIVEFKLGTHFVCSTNLAFAFHWQTFHPEWSCCTDVRNTLPVPWTWLWWHCSTTGVDYPPCHIPDLKNEKKIITFLDVNFDFGYIYGWYMDDAASFRRPVTFGGRMISSSGPHNWVQKWQILLKSLL